MLMYTKIFTRLTQEFDPIFLELSDNSHLHHGHAEAGFALETHFSLKIASKKFNYKTRLERHRLIHFVLKDLLISSVHALSIHALSELDLCQNET